MAANASGIGKSAGIYGLGMLVGRLSSILLLPIYTRILTPADYGVLEVIDLSVQIITLVLGIGLAGDALFYFFAKAESKVQKSRVFSTVLASATAAGFIGASIAWLLSGWISLVLFKDPKYELLVRVGVLAIAFNLPFETLLSHLRLTDQAVLYTIVSVGRLAFTILLNLGFLMIWKLGALSILLSSIISAFPFICFLLVRVYTTHLQLTWPDQRLVKDIAIYSAPLGVTSLLLMAINFGDRFFLVRYISVSELGLYGMAYKFGMLVGYVSVSFQMFWRANMHSILKDDDGDRVFVKLMTWLAIVYGTVTLGSIIFSKMLFALATGPDFLRAEVYLPWIALAYSLRAIEFQLQSTFLTTAKTREVLITTAVGAIVSVSGYAVLVPILQAWGAVWATLLGFASMLAVTAVRSSRIKKYDFERNKLLWMAFAVSGALLLRFILQGWTNPWIWGAACLAFAVSMLLGPPLSEERSMLVALLRRRFGPKNQEAASRS